MPAINWDFHLPTRVHFGWGRAAEAADIVKGSGAERVFVMAGKSYLKNKGGAEALAAQLAPARMTLFADTEENPSIATVDKAARLCAEAKCEAVLAIGGGSVLDAAKAVAMLQHNEGSVRDYLDRTRSCARKGVFFVAVPTTSGTGSEVTPFSVITNHEKNAKPALAFPQLFPDVAIVDPELAMSMPLAVAASTGLDALTQAVEGFWSTRGTDISRALAFRAIVMVWRNIERACLDKDPAAVTAMASASCICGVEMAMVGNTAIHPLSYPITLDYGVAHGFACVLFLPAFLRYNAPVLDDLFTDLLRVLGFADAFAFADALEAMMTRLGAPTRLGQVGVKADALPAIARAGIGGSTPANPRPVTEADIIEICRGML